MYCNIIIYATNGDSVLAISNNDIHNGDIRLPTGRIALGEKSIDAAVRIINEQTGCIANPLYLSIEYKTYQNNELVLVYYIDGRTLNDTFMLNDQKVKANWYSQRAISVGAFGKINQEILDNI